MFLSYEFSWGLLINPFELLMRWVAGAFMYYLAGGELPDENGNTRTDILDRSKRGSLYDARRRTKKLFEHFVLRTESIETKYKRKQQEQMIAMTNMESRTNLSPLVKTQSMVPPQTRSQSLTINPTVETQGSMSADANAETANPFFGREPIEESFETVDLDITDDAEAGVPRDAGPQTVGAVLTPGGDLPTQ